MKITYSIMLSQVYKCQGDMMKTVLMISVCVITMGLTYPVKAEKFDKILVYSAEQSNGSVSVGQRWAYTKNLEINLINMGDSELELSAVCFRATSPEHKTFKLDTIDEKLTTGVLKPKQLIKGNITFASESLSIHKSILISLSDKCVLP